MKKILIVGGTGITGKIIYQELAKNNQLIVYYTSRKDKNLKNEKCVFFDVNDDTQKNISLLSGYDFVVIALGPFEKYLNHVHRLCILSKVTCIDINDSIEAVKEIQSLENLAKEEGTAVLTGFGLCPGLSTLMIHTGISKETKEVLLRLYIGKQKIGKSATVAMLSTISDEYPVITKGNECQIRDTTIEKYHFYGMGKAVYLIGYENPEIFTYEWFKENKMNYSYKVHFESLKEKQFKWLLKLKWFKQQNVASFFALLYTKFLQKRATVFDQSQCILEVTFVDDSNKYKKIVKGKSSYYMTAMFVSIIVSEIIEKRLELPVGVSSFENISFSYDSLISRLEEKNIDFYLDEYNG